MTNNSEQLQEAPAQEPVIETIEDVDEIEDIDDEATAMLDEYLHTIEEVRGLPDAEQRLARIRGTIQILAGHPERAGLKNPGPEMTDEGPDDQEQTTKLHQMLEDIKKRPEGHLELGFIEILLEDPGQIRALYRHWRARGETESRLSDKEEYRVHAAEAAHDLAFAFTKVIEHRDFIHASHFNAITDAMNALIAESEWESDDEVLGEVLPHILKASIWKNRPDRYQ